MAEESISDATDRVIRSVVHYRAFITAVWVIFGGGITALTYRFFLLDRIIVNERRISALEVQSSSVEEKLGIILKSQCLDRTLSEQQLLNMFCPSELYKRGTLP